MNTDSTISIDLHLDINGTLIAVDFSEGRNVLEEECLQTFLAKKIKATWEGSEEITYMQYLEKKYPSREDLRKNRKDELFQIFTNMEIVKHPKLDKYIDLYDKALEILKIKSEESQHVFPSVIKLIEALQQQQIQITLLLRTFGSDGPRAGAEITKRFDNIQFQPPIHLRGTSMSIDALKQFDHQIIRDDFLMWKKSGDDRALGKSFPNYDSNNRFSFFFDDNINKSADCETKNIVNPYDPITGTSLSIQDLINSSLFRVNTLKAVVYEDYFVEKLNKAFAKKGVNITLKTAL